VLWGLAILLVLLVLRRRSGQNGEVPREARIFLKLRNAGRRAGMPPSALHSPLALVRHLEGTRHPAAPAARKVVDDYVRARFSGVLMREEEERDMREALRAATLLLRKKAVLGRENAVLGRENAGLGRENAGLGRENALLQEEISRK
jgi:hypothetical protein